MNNFKSFIRDMPIPMLMIGMVWSGCMLFALGNLIYLIMRDTNAIFYVSGIALLYGLARLLKRYANRP